MSRRIDIELTSQTGDGSWTWRAAGARQPKGTVEAALVPAGEAVGAVLRADVEIGLEGIEILSLTAAKPARSPEKTEGRIEVKGTPKRAPDVSVILAPGSDKRRRDRDDDGERRDRRGGSRRGPSPGERRARASAAAIVRPRGGGRALVVPAAAVPARVTGARLAASAPSRRRPPCTATPCWRRCGPSRSRWPSSCCAAACRPSARPSRRRTPSNKAAGKPPVASDALLAMADELLPAVRLADWKDRASVAQTAGKDYRLRELRAVVAASRTVNLDEEGRAMAKALQESLDQRTTALREEWLARITNALNDGRVQQAVEASIRPPEPGTRCPAELAVRLAAAAGEAMTADLAPEDWMRLLDAVVASPVRRTVKPVGHPRRRGGQAGGPQRRRRGPRPGQAARAAHPAAAAAPGERRAPLQSNRRLSVSRRAVNPAASRRCLVVRSPGSASASTSAQPRLGAPGHGGRP